MSTKPDAVRIGGWAQTLEDVDREVGRLATLCGLRILERGVIDRVLKNDRSICGTDNPLAFAKLRDLLIMHFALRGKWAAELGEADAAAIEEYVIERLRPTLPEQTADWPPV
jgi:hypothetical protein